MIKAFSAFSGSSKYSIKEYVWKGNDVKFKKSNPPTSLLSQLAKSVDHIQRRPVCMPWLHLRYCNPLA